MTIPEKMREILKDKGHTQTWAVDKMNKACPGLEMTLQKMSFTLNGSRKLLATELVAFCKATDTSPNEFWHTDAA